MSSLELLLSAIGIVINFVSLALGFKKWDLSSFWTTWIFVADLALIIAGFILMGWLGLVLAAALLPVVVVIYSVRLAMIWESKLSYAATQSSSTLEDMKTLAKRLRRSHKVLRYLRPVELAQLISYLSQRNRNINEVEEMAAPIAMLWLIHKDDLERTELGSLVHDFDRALRLHSRPASDSKLLADRLTGSIKHSAATFEEMLEALIAIGEPQSPNKDISPS